MYIDNYQRWTGAQLQTHWTQQVGGAELLLPAHVVYEYCHPTRPRLTLALILRQPTRYLGREKSWSMPQMGGQMVVIGSSSDHTSVSALF